jgi:hypothetical protein
VNLLLDFAKVPPARQDLLANLSPDLKQGDIGRMQDHAVGLDVLFQRAKNRVGRVVPELAIDLGVEENVVRRQRLGRPMLLLQHGSHLNSSLIGSAVAVAQVVSEKAKGFPNKEKPMAQWLQQ